MGIFGRMQRAYGAKKARAAGINTEKYLAYEEAKKKELYLAEQKAKREYQEGMVRKKYADKAKAGTFKDRLRSVGKQLKKANVKRKANIGLGYGGSSSQSAGPQFGLDSDKRSAFVINVRR